MRFYSRNCIEQPKFKTTADKENWLSCHSIIKDLPTKDRQLLIAVYSGYDTLPDEVYNASLKYNVDQNYIWDMMKVVERKIARKRELI